VEGNREADSKNEESLKKQAVTSIILMGCTMTTRILGFIRNAVIAAIFGTTVSADIINAVFNIPNNFRKLLAEGALSAAFIPVLSETLVTRPDSSAARRLVRNIMSLQILILVPLLIVFTVFSRPIIGVLLNFSQPEALELSSGLFRWVSHYLFFVSLGAILMAVLNTHGIFVTPALTPLLFSVAVIGSILLFHKSLGIYSMAVGVLSGGFMQVAFQWPLFRRRGYRFVPDFGFDNDDVKKVLKLWLPVVATSSIFAVNQQIALRFASGLEGGSISHLVYALPIFQLPFGVFSASVTTVLFPRMSRQVASGSWPELGETVRYGLRFLILLLVPAAVFFIIMGQPLVQIVYQRGAFSPQSTVLTARTLAGYSYGLLSVGMFTFMQRFFYACKDYRTPFWIAVVVTLSDIFLSLWLKETPLRVVGLAIANSAAFSLGLPLMVLFARQKLGRIGGRDLLGTATRTIIAVAPPALMLVLYRAKIGAFQTAALSFAKALGLIGGLLGFVALVLLLYYLSGEGIVRELVRKRWKI
jgi:putative peptidoglycan lipid II flippase